MSRELDSTKIDLFSNFTASADKPPPTTRISVTNTTPQVDYDVDAQVRATLKENRTEIQNFLAQTIQNVSFSVAGNDLAINKFNRVTTDGRVRISLIRTFDKYVVNINVQTGATSEEAPVPKTSLPKFRKPLNANVALLYDTTGSNWQMANGTLLPLHTQTIKDSKAGFDVGEDYYVNTIQVGVGSQGDVPIAPYGDKGDSPFSMNLNLVRLRDFGGASLTAYDGNDTREAQYDAVIQAASQFDWVRSAVNVIMHFTDTAPHVGGAHATADDTIAALKKARVVYAGSPITGSDGKDFGIPLEGNSLDFRQLINKAVKFAKKLGWAV